jgi:ParB/RepB/Spo0J family partition protein
MDLDGKWKLESQLLTDCWNGPNQPRVTGASKNIDELAASIDAVGLLQPIGICVSEEVQKLKGDEKTYKYQIVWGQRRYQAYELLKEEKGDEYKSIPAMLFKGSKPLTNEEITILATTENVYQQPMSKEDIWEAVKGIWLRNGQNTKKVSEITGWTKASIDEAIQEQRFTEIPDAEDFIGWATDKALVTKFKEQEIYNMVDRCLNIDNTLNLEKAKEYHDALAEADEDLRKNIIICAKDDELGEVETWVEDAKAKPVLREHRIKIVDEKNSKLETLASHRGMKTQDLILEAIDDLLDDEGL